MSEVADQSRLVERLRAAIAEPSTREVVMFGARAFMVDDEMLVCAQKGGDLLVCIDPGDSERLLAQPGAAPAEMGRSRRPMGAGWISVSADAITRSERLSFWIDVARARNR